MVHRTATANGFLTCLRYCIPDTWLIDTQHCKSTTTPRMKSFMPAARLPKEQDGYVVRGISSVHPTDLGRRRPPFQCRGRRPFHVAVTATSSRKAARTYDDATVACLQRNLRIPQALGQLNEFLVSYRSLASCAAHGEVPPCPTLQAREVGQRGRAVRPRGPREGISISIRSISIRSSSSSSSGRGSGSGSNGAAVPLATRGAAPRLPRPVDPPASRGFAREPRQCLTADRSVGPAKRTRRELRSKDVCVGSSAARSPIPNPPQHRHAPFRFPRMAIFMRRLRVPLA
jgi:hypothetical protein